MTVKKFAIFLILYISIFCFMGFEKSDNMVKEIPKIKDSNRKNIPIMDKYNFEIVYKNGEVKGIYLPIELVSYVKKKPFKLRKIGKKLDNMGGN